MSNRNAFDTRLIDATAINSPTVIALKKLGKDHWTATYQETLDEGKGPLSAVHYLFAKLHEARLTVVEEPETKVAEANRRTAKSS